MNGFPLRLFLRLREWGGWALVMVEANWMRAPAPVRVVLRGVARMSPIRRWLRGE
ncbi:MAG: hypothetical protein J7521_06565 [Caulobacter sp.]|nr:hypothetical protein [Caulobacter sp.]